jgi:hypothetical protein
VLFVGVGSSSGTNVEGPGQAEGSRAGRWAEVRGVFGSWDGGRPVEAAGVLDAGRVNGRDRGLHFVVRNGHRNRVAEHVQRRRRTGSERSLALVDFVGRRKRDFVNGRKLLMPMTFARRVDFRRRTGRRSWSGRRFFLSDPALHVLDDGGTRALGHFGGGRLDQFEVGVERLGFAAAFGGDAVFAGEKIASAVIEALPIIGGQSVAERLRAQTGLVDGRGERRSGLDSSFSLVNPGFPSGAEGLSLRDPSLRFVARDDDAGRIVRFDSRLDFNFCSQGA